MKNLKLNFLSLFPTHYFLLVLICLPLLWNLLRPGFYTSHDGEWMVIRLSAFHQALRTGQIPVRWTQRLNRGWGYPVLNFLYPLPFYLSEPAYALTGNPSTAVQAVMGISVVLMIFGMFFLLQPWGNLPALAGSVIYAASPYVGFNLYQRGSFGEIVAMGIAPWVFWALSRNKLVLSCVLVATLITSHNVVAILFFPLIILYLIVRTVYAPASSRGSHMIRYGIVILLALGLSAFFWIPALAELRFVRASTTPVSNFDDEYLTISDALTRTGIPTAVSFIGLPILPLTNMSAPLWNALSPIKVIQFPWRILSVATFTSGVIWTLVLTKLPSVGKIFLAALLAILTLVGTTNFLTPVSFVDRPVSYYQTNDDTTTVRSEYAPIWSTIPPERPAQPGETLYYPGWKTFVGGKEITIETPTIGTGVFKVWGETPLRMTADIISAISLLILLAGAVKWSV